MKLISQIAHGTCEGRTLCNDSSDTDCIKKTSKELRAGCSIAGYKALKVCHQFLGKACSINDDFGDEELAELLVLLNSTEELIHQSEQLNYSSHVMLLFLLSPYVDRKDVEDGLRELLGETSSDNLKRTILYILSAKKPETYSSETIRIVQKFSRDEDVNTQKAAFLTLINIGTEESKRRVRELMAIDDPVETFRRAFIFAFMGRGASIYGVQYYPGIFDPLECYCCVDNPGSVPVDRKLYIDEIRELEVIAGNSELWNKRLINAKSLEEAKEIYKARGVISQYMIHFFYGLELQRSKKVNGWWEPEWEKKYAEVVSKFQ